MAIRAPVEFVEAHDGANALSLLDSGSYDLVITDLNMPKMDGMTFVWKVKMARKETVGEIIVLSSMDNAQVRAALFGLGVKHYLQKPVSPAKIAECVGW
jgi:YesN/AraC family two-component response regulator